MASTSSNTQSAIFLPNIMLDSMNYHIWLFRLKVFLKSQNLYGFVDGSYTCPPSTVLSHEGTPLPNDAYSNWVIQDNHTIHMVCQTLGTMAMKCVVGCHSAHDVWTKLLLKFAAPTKLRIRQLKEKFQRIKKGNNLIDVYLESIKEAQDILETVGVFLSNEEVVDQILSGLPRSYNPTKSLVRLTCPNASIDKLKVMLQDVEADLAEDIDNEVLAPFTTPISTKCLQSSTSNYIAPSQGHSESSHITNQMMSHAATILDAYLVGSGINLLDNGGAQTAPSTAAYTSCHSSPLTPSNNTSSDSSHFNQACPAPTNTHGYRSHSAVMQHQQTTLLPASSQVVQSFASQASETASKCQQVTTLEGINDSSEVTRQVSSIPYRTPLPVNQFGRTVGCLLNSSSLEFGTSSPDSSSHNGAALNGSSVFPAHVFGAQPVKNARAYHGFSKDIATKHSLGILGAFPCNVSTPQDPKIICQLCNKPGHMARTCHLFDNRQAGSMISKKFGLKKCLYCNKDGHTKDRCYNLIGFPANKCCKRGQ